MEISTSMELGQLAERMGDAATVADARAMRELLGDSGYSETGDVPQTEWAAMLERAVASAADLVAIEYMPEHLRASHEAAGNAGIYPHNGAVRYACSQALADDMVETFGDWCRIVEADPARYSVINSYPE